MNAQNKAYTSVLSLVASVGLSIVLNALLGPTFGTQGKQVLILASLVINVLLAAVVRHFIVQANQESDLRTLLGQTLVSESQRIVNPIEPMVNSRPVVVAARPVVRRSTSNQMLTAVRPSEVRSPVSATRPVVTDAEFTSVPKTTALTTTYGRSKHGALAMAPVRMGQRLAIRA